MDIEFTTKKIPHLAHSSSSSMNVAFPPEIFTFPFIF